MKLRYWFNRQLGHPAIEVVATQNGQVLGQASPHTLEAGDRLTLRLKVRALDPNGLPILAPLDIDPICITTRAVRK